MLNAHRNRRYLLVTPARDEEAFVFDLVESVKKQSLTPLLWVIVDDGSSDRTAEIVKAETAALDWATVVRLPQGQTKRRRGYEYACQQGFGHALTRVDDWEFIGIVDADIVLERDYFERLVTEFERDDRLGMASGVLYHQGKLEKTTATRAIGGCGLFRRQCFVAVGAHDAYPGDAMSNARAKTRGWKALSFPTIRATHQRPLFGVEGAWNGALLRAREMYYYDYHPVLMIGAFGSFLTKRPHYHAIAFALECLRNILMHKDRIPDEEIRRHFRTQRWREVMSNIRAYLG